MGGQDWAAEQLADSEEDQIFDEPHGGPMIGLTCIYWLPAKPGQYRHATISYVHNGGNANLCVHCGLRDDFPESNGFPVAFVCDVGHRCDSDDKRGCWDYLVAVPS